MRSSPLCSQTLSVPVFLALWLLQATSGGILGERLPLYEKNGGNERAADPGIAAEAGAVIWHYPDENRFPGSPALDEEGRFYIGNDAGQLFCFSREGEKLWEFDAGSLVVGTPVIGHDGTIYAGAAEPYLSTEFPRIHGRLGTLYALNRDGTVRWQFGESGVVAAPSIAPDGSLLFGTVANRFYSLRPDGTVQWEIDQNERQPGWAIVSSAALDAGGNVFFGTLTQLRLDGSVSWNRLFASESSSSPALGGDGAIYVGQNSPSGHGILRNLFAFRRDGSIQWRFEAGQIRSSPVIGAEGTLYFGSDDRWFYALAPEGSLLWKFETGGAVGGSAAIDAEGNVYFGSHDGKMYALAPDGALLWDRVLGQHVRSSPAIGPDGRIYIAADGGGVYILQGKAPLADTAWPMIHHDPAHRGRSSVTPLPPVVPQNLAASQGSLIGLIRLSWEPVPWAASYELRRNTTDDLAGAEALVPEWSGPTEFHDESAISGQTYYYWVRARNSLGESEFSTSASGHQNLNVREIQLGPAKTAVFAPAIGEDGTLHLPVNGPERRVVALDPEGVVQWEFTAPTPASLSEVVVGRNGSLYFASDRKVYSLDRNGSLQWEFTAGNLIVNAPAVTLGGLILVTSLDGHLYALDEGGSELWKQNLNCTEDSIPVVGPNGNIYIAQRNLVIAVSPNGLVLWTSARSQPINGRIAVSEDGALSFGLGFNFLETLNPDGTLKWSVDLGSGVRGMPSLAEDGAVYCATLQRIYAFAPDGALLKAVELPPMRRVATPLLLGADGSIFFTTQDGYLVKWDRDFQFKGSYHFGENLFSPRLNAAMILAPDGSLYLGGGQGRLLVFEGQTPLAENGWPSVRRDVRQSGSAAPPLSPPSTPDGLETIADGKWAGMVRLKWNAPAVFAQFQLWRSTQPELSSATLIADFAGSDSFDDRSAEPGVSYYYWLKAWNAAGESEFAGPVNASAASGVRLLWQTELTQRLRDPAVGLDGTVYVDDWGNLLHAIDPATGETRWSYPGAHHPAIHGNGFLVARNSQGLLALDSHGEVKWEYAGESVVDTLPAICTKGTIYWANSLGLEAISPEGERQWIFEAPNLIYVSPAIGPDGAIYFGTELDNKLYALSPDGSLKWTYSFESDLGESPAFSPDGTIYLGSDQEYHALNPNGTLRWKRALGWVYSGFPSVSPNGALLGPVNSAHLHVLRPDGAPWWDLPIASRAPAVAGDGTIFLDGATRISAFNPEGEMQWQYEVHPPGDPRFQLKIGAPVLTDSGTLYFTFDNRLVALQTSHPAASGGWTMFRGNSRRTGSAEGLESGMRVTARRNSHGDFTLEFPSHEGDTYRIEISEDLRIWRLLTTLPGSAANTLFMETIDPSTPQRYFRINADPGAE